MGAHHARVNATCVEGVYGERQHHLPCRADSEILSVRALIARPPGELLLGGLRSFSGYVYCNATVERGVSCIAGAKCSLRVK